MKKINASKKLRLKSNELRKRCGRSVRRKKRRDSRRLKVANKSTYQSNNRLLQSQRGDFQA